MEGREPQAARGGVGSGHSASQARISNPGRAARRVLVYFHFTSHHFLVHKFRYGLTAHPSPRPPSPSPAVSRLGRNPQSLPLRWHQTPPSPLFPTNHNPPPYFGENNVQLSSHPPPGDSTRGPSSLIGTRRLYPPPTFLELLRTSPRPALGTRRLGHPSTFGRDLELFPTCPHGTATGPPPVLQT